MVAPMAALLALASLLALLSGSAAAAPPLLIRVDPRAPPSPATPRLGATTVRSATTTLGGAASTLAAALAEGSRDVAIELSPGAHRVPVGGLHLTAAHTPASAGHSVTWRCASGGCAARSMAGSMRRTLTGGGWDSSEALPRRSCGRRDARSTAGATLRRRGR